MLSPQCRIQDFFKATQDKSYNDIILMADKEATEAERNYYRKAPYADSFRSYAETLKNLIYFMRHYIQPNCCETAMTEADLKRVRAKFQ